MKLGNLADPEAEKIVLGSFLGGRNGKVSLSEVFFFAAHRIIYDALVEMEARNRPADIITLTQVLRERGELDSVGGPSAVTELETSYSKSPAIVEYELKRLHELHAKRKARTLGKRMERGDIDPTDALRELASITEAAKAGVTVRQPRIRFFAPRELRDFQQPESDIILVGDAHISRGEVFTIGGEPGVGKSRAATQLGISGATRRPWFGLPVHRQFKTMVVQTENGRYRLQQEFSALDCDEIENWVRVSEPPPFGLTLNNPEFQGDVRAALDCFKPDCVILDPWNAAARDDKQRDYVETFDALRNLLPTGDDKPALGVIAHTHKPQLKKGGPVEPD
jgi:AAA domain/DnaB-like helicase N terminal domain